MNTQILRRRIVFQRVQAEGGVQNLCVAGTFVCLLDDDDDLPYQRDYLLPNIRSCRPLLLQALPQVNRNSLSFDKIFARKSQILVL